MTYTAQREVLAKVKPEIEALLVQHHAEVGAHKERFVLDVDWEYYLYLEYSGQGRTFTLRRDGVLVGYWTGIVKRHQHYNSRTAYTNADYVMPDARGSARTLYGFAERFLRTEGCQRLYNKSKLNHVNAKGQFLEALGYELDEMCYAKVL